MRRSLWNVFPESREQDVVSGEWEYRVATSISCVCARARVCPLEIKFIWGKASLSNNTV